LIGLEVQAEITENLENDIMSYSMSTTNPYNYIAKNLKNYRIAGEFMVNSSLFNGHNAGSEARTSNPTNTDDTLNYAQNIGSYNAQELN